MKINRSVLLDHLNRIACGRQIPEAVFSGKFETVAISPDHLLFVQAPPLKGAKKLKGEVGLPDLPLFGKLATKVGEEESVTLTVDDSHRLIVDRGEGRRVRYMTAAPTTIATRLEKSIVQKILDKAPADGEGFALPRSVIDEVVEVFRVLKDVEEVTLFIGTDGSRFVVGGEMDHQLIVDLPELKGSEEYELLFGAYLIDLFDILVSDAPALHLSGPASMIRLEDGDFTYIVSPMARGA